MKLFSKFSLNKENYFTLLISLIPISFIAGNMIININILLLIFSGLIFFYKDFFKLKYFFLDKILFTYFSLILLVGIYNDFYLYLNFNDFYQNPYRLRGLLRGMSVIRTFRAFAERACSRVFHTL